MLLFVFGHGVKETRKIAIGPEKLKIPILADLVPRGCNVTLVTTAYYSGGWAAAPTQHHHGLCSQGGLHDPFVGGFGEHWQSLWEWNSSWCGRTGITLLDLSQRWSELESRHPRAWSFKKIPPERQPDVLRYARALDLASIPGRLSSLSHRLSHLVHVPPARGSHSLFDWDGRSWEPPLGFTGYWCSPAYDNIFNLWPDIERDEEGHFWHYPIFYVDSATRDAISTGKRAMRFSGRLRAGGLLPPYTSRWEIMASWA